METRFSLDQMFVGFVVCASVLTQVGCTGGGFTARDAKLPETIEVRVGGQEAPPQVPEIAKPDEQQGGQNNSGATNNEEQTVVLDDAGNVIPAVLVCSDEYMQKHNELHELFLQLAAFEETDKSQEEQDRAIANLRLANQKCEQFALKFAGVSCKAKLKSNNEQVIASYRSLLQKECEIVAESIRQLDGAPADPSIDPSNDNDTLSKDLVTLMGEEQVVEAAIKDVSGFAAASNSDQDISKVWIGAEIKELNLESANALAVQQKKDFCSVSGFLAIGGEGELTHRMMKAEVSDAGTDLKSFTIHVMSYRAGQNASDHANGWLIKCSGPKETLKVNLQTVKAAFGENLEIKIVGPQ